MDSSTSTSPLHQAFPKTSSLSSVALPPPLPLAPTSPDADVQLPSLDLVRREDLQDLMIDEAYHHAFVNTLPQVRAKLDEIDRLERENQELAGQSIPTS